MTRVVYWVALPVASERGYAGDDDRIAPRGGSSADIPTEGNPRADHLALDRSQHQLTPLQKNKNLPS
jgi:hypothetical protein